MGKGKDALDFAEFYGLLKSAEDLVEKSSEEEEEALASGAARSPVMDEGDVAENELRRGARGVMHHFRRGLRMVTFYKGNALLALDCFAAAHGWWDMTGCKNAVELSVKHFGMREHKQAVAECMLTFQRCLGIPPMPGQRDRQAKRNMKQARKDQLK